MTTDKYLDHRGDLKALIPLGESAAFVTAHPEGHATALYRLDVEKQTLTASSLPAGVGGVAMAAEGETIWVAGTDKCIYVCDTGGAPKPLGTALDGDIASVVPLANDRLGVVSGASLVLLSRKNGKILQTLELPEAGTVAAVEPSGRWIAVGTAKGNVSVFECEEKPEFVLSANERLHEGAVTALLFERDDLRFLSAGADLKLLTTHARGRLEPEDKGRGNNHTDIVTALAWGPGDRFYTGSKDGSIKSWPRVGGVKPATLKDGIVAVLGLAVVEVQGRFRLVAACHDNTLRIVPVDSGGKLGEVSHRVHGALAKAKNEFDQNDPKRREAALDALASFDDAKSIEAIADQVERDSDHVLRLHAAELVGKSSHPKAIPFLEGFLKHRDEAVRRSAFASLGRLRGESDSRRIELALQAEKPDIGTLAIEALAKLAASDDRAHSRLGDAINANTREVRQAAVLALESIAPDDSPEPNLFALKSKHADVRMSGLLRLRSRGLLDPFAVQTALRRKAEDSDADVRRVAFLLSLETRPALLAALRAKDADLDRQVSELDSGAAEARDKPKKRGKGSEKSDVGSLDDTSIEPLLQATACRSLDVCLRGAYGLALLNDPRAFGLLLQLSREPDNAARAEVCRAMAALGDSRSVERLRSLLHDPEAEVRDAAFSALARIHKGSSLVAAESGLNASHEDVRRRALQLLIDHLRQAPDVAEALPLLARALNDSNPAVRNEAFKSALSLKAIGGGVPGSLTFILGSIHANVRRDVLTEVMAQASEPWALDLLLSFFNDPDAGLREEAFAFATKKAKGLELLDAALGSRYADLRKRAVDGLIKKHTAAAQTLLIRALEDEDRDVRLAALSSLVDNNAVASLTKALSSGRDDVRLRAAKALARRGDLQARGPLIDLATAPQPEQKERVADWLTMAEGALQGLSDLGDPSTITRLLPLLDSPHGSLRKWAARAIAWSSGPESADALKIALRHDDGEVRAQAALGLCLTGDASAAPVLSDDPCAKNLPAIEKLAASVALGDGGEDRLVVALDDPASSVRDHALLILLSREWKAPRGDASRLLAALSSQSPSTRLIAAKALETLADPVAFASFLHESVNDRGEAPAWKISATTVDALATLIALADPPVRARSVSLLLPLLRDKEQAAFDLAWSVHEPRYISALTLLKEKVGSRAKSAVKYDAHQLRDLAFGAYIGLVRNPAPDPKKKAQSSQHTVEIRQSALRRLLALASSDPRHALTARPVFIQALGDSTGAVRTQAFDHARSIGTPPAILAAEALATGHSDVGILGFELLTIGAGEAESREVLEQAMLTRKDDLAYEAARLLIAREGLPRVADRALDALSDKLRTQAVLWLASACDESSEAQASLRKALQSRHPSVRESAAFELSNRKDPAAFDALAAMLRSENAQTRSRAIRALERLGDPRAIDAFLGRLADDPAGTAPTDELLRAVGAFRRPEAVDRLVALWQSHPNRRPSIFQAVLIISGYDQANNVLDDSPDDEGNLPDPAVAELLAKQHPRKDAVLARLMELVSVPQEAKLLSTLVPSARLARDKGVGTVLGTLAAHGDEDLRRKIVEALAWRLRFRDGDPEPLRKALTHKDPVTQFLAAEGLARAGLGDGLSILLAAVEYATDLQNRIRAVSALGILADDRALDVLLKLASEDGHALQETAAEAIGRLGRSARSKEILSLLERMAKGDGGVARSSLIGLRWINNRDAWRILRERAADDSLYFQAEIIRLLGHDDDPATRDLLLKLVRDGDYDILESAYQASVQLFGADDFDPAYALISNPNSAAVDEFDSILAKVLARGDASRLLTLIATADEETARAIGDGLLRRDPPPIKEAGEAIASPDAGVVAASARILALAGGRRGQDRRRRRVRPPAPHPGTGETRQIRRRPRPLGFTVGFLEDRRGHQCPDLGRRSAGRGRGPAHQDRRGRCNASRSGRIPGAGRAGPGGGEEVHPRDTIGPGAVREIGARGRPFGRGPGGRADGTEGCSWALTRDPVRPGGIPSHRDRVGRRCVGGRIAAGFGPSGPPPGGRPARPDHAQGCEDALGGGARQGLARGRPVGGDRSTRRDRRPRVRGRPAGARDRLIRG